MTGRPPCGGPFYDTRGAGGFFPARRVMHCGPTVRGMTGGHTPWAGGRE